MYRSGRALDRVLLLKIGRGLYARTDYPGDSERQIALACKGVPAGVVCLESAAKYHGLFPFESASIWMAVDSKAKKPVVDGLNLCFVRFSGDALTQGIVNTKIDGVPVRIYSAAKTVTDCLKQRRTIGSDRAAQILRESIAGKKCSKQRLRYSAKICRVYKLIHVAYSSADPSAVS